MPEIYQHGKNITSYSSLGHTDHLLIVVFNMPEAYPLGKNIVSKQNNVPEALPINVIHPHNHL